MMDVLANIIEYTTVGDWILLAFGIVFTVFLVGTWRYDFFRRQGLESTKPKLPFLGDNLSALLGRRPFAEVLKEQYKRSEGHGVFGMFEFTEPMLMIRDPELLKIITVKEFDKFINHRDIGVADPVFSKLLINLQDQKWRDIRATLSPAFTTSKIKRMFNLVSQCGDQMVKHLQQLHGNGEGTSRQPTNMKDLFARLANDVIATVAFGTTCDSLKDSENEFFRMGKSLTTFSRLRSLATLGYLLFPRVMKFFTVRVLDAKATKFFDTLVHETIQARQNNNIVRPDMLHLLMQARQGDLKPEDTDTAEVEEVRAEKTRLHDDDVTAQAVVFFFAGFETVSTALCFATYALSHNEEVQKKLQAEIQEKISTSDELTYEVVQSMKYFDAVINEVLRMYPPAIGTDRMCQADANLPAAGKSPAFVIRKGQVVTIPIVALHHDPQYWPEPEKFDPERFNDQNKPNIRPFTYMPFGFGPRICIGQRLALLEIKLVLVHLLSNFDVLPSDKMKHPIEYETGLNVTAKGGFWCELSRRDTSVS